MNMWVLILLVGANLWGGPKPATAEFHDQKACRQAGEQVRADHPNVQVAYSCVPKNGRQETTP